MLGTMKLFGRGSCSDFPWRPSLWENPGEAPEMPSGGAASHWEEKLRDIS